MLSVFVHSTGTGPAMWADAPLREGTTRVALPNLGYAPRPRLERGTPCTVDDDVDALLAVLPAGDVHLYAHSYGGLIALRLATRLGARVQSMWLYEPILFGALRHEVDADSAAVAEAQEFGDHPWFLTDDARGGTEEWLEVFIDYWNRPGSWARMPEPMKAATRALGWKMYQEVRSCWFDASSFDAHPLPAVPCTLVTGERTTPAARAMTLALARRTPHARVVEIAGAGHMALLTQPALVYPVLG